MIVIFISMFYNRIFHKMNESYTNLGESISPYINEHNKEYNNMNGASNTKVHQSHTYGDYPLSENGGLVSDSFPSTNHNGVSNYQEQMMWWHYPVFKVGSYEQITNNKKWTTPENGSALFPPINGMSLYKCGCQK
jgi:hypothetical protein